MKSGSTSWIFDKHLKHGTACKTCGKQWANNKKPHVKEEHKNKNEKVYDNTEHKDKEQWPTPGEMAKNPFTVIRAHVQEKFFMPKTSKDAEHAIKEAEWEELRARMSAAAAARDNKLATKLVEQLTKEMQAFDDQPANFLEPTPLDERSGKVLAAELDRVNELASVAYNKTAKLEREIEASRAKYMLYIAARGQIQQRIDDDHSLKRKLKAEPCNKPNLPKPQADKLRDLRARQLEAARLEATLEEEEKQILAEAETAQRAELANEPDLKRKKVDEQADDKGANADDNMVDAVPNDDTGAGVGDMGLSQQNTNVGKDTAAAASSPSTAMANLVDTAKREADLGLALGTYKAQPTVKHRAGPYDGPKEC